jgi:hypothetical protein
MTSKAVNPAGSMFADDLSTVDPEIFSAISKELGRQRDDIELIASPTCRSTSATGAENMREVAGLDTGLGVADIAGSYRRAIP